MNIFYLSHSPKQCAKWMVDRHVVKMILETAQLLSTAHRILDGEEYIEKKNGRNIKRWKLDSDLDQKIYSATHVNHPSAVWARESIQNYDWLHDHFTCLCHEYSYRYHKRHKCHDMSKYLVKPPKNIPDVGMTPVKCAMKPEFIISEDAVINYRNYYRNGKKHLFKWTDRDPPKWLSGDLEVPEIPCGLFQSP